MAYTASTIQQRYSNMAAAAALQRNSLQERKSLPGNGSAGRPHTTHNAAVLGVPHHRPACRLGIDSGLLTVDSVAARAAVAAAMPPPPLDGSTSILLRPCTRYIIRPTRYRGIPTIRVLHMNTGHTLLTPLMSTNRATYLH